MQHVVHIETLPETSLDAASEFAARWLPTLREQINAKDTYVLVLPEADENHTGWRRAVIRDLARAYAPARVNMVGGTGADSLQATLLYLSRANGLTGQYLPLSPDSGR